MSRWNELTPKDDVAAARRELSPRALDLWDAADEYDACRDNPTRPSDAELLPPVEDDGDEMFHKHLGCGHWCACRVRPKTPLCRKCKTAAYNLEMAK